MNNILTLGDSYEVDWLSSAPVQAKYVFGVEQCKNDYEAMMYTLNHLGEVDLIVADWSALEDDGMDLLWLAHRLDIHVLLLVPGTDEQFVTEHLAGLPLTILEQGGDLRLFAEAVFYFLYGAKDASRDDIFVGV